MADKHFDDPADAAPAAVDPRDAEETSPADATATALDDLQRERDDLYDRLLRKSAEFDNYRKRVDRERREQADQGIVDLLLELLLVVDDFGLALAAEGSEGAQSKQEQAYRKGVELIHAKLLDLLSKRGVRPIEALGADFDPTLHQAVVHEASPGHREGEIIGELRRGYMMGDRLLRPAMVKVAKA
jgi:molecular chaperone GrpE